MRNKQLWRPTKVAFGFRGQLRVPGRRGELNPGSTLIATLMARWYRRSLGKYARGTLLEIGCGKMPFYQLYEPFVGEVVCTDWPQSLHGTDFRDFSSDLNAGIPLKAGSVDCILASDVLEHIYEPTKVLREMLRVLRPGGVALLNTPFLYWIHETPHDYFRYTQFAIRRMATDAGFIVETLDPIGGSALVLCDVVGKILQSIPVLGAIASTGLQRLACLGVKLPRSDTWPLFIAAALRKPV